VINPKCFLNERADGLEEIIYVKHQRCLLRDRIDCFQLLSATALKRIKARIL